MATSNKICNKCFQTKSINKFSLRDKIKKIYRNECKACLCLLRKKQPSYGKWHKNNKQKLKEYMRKYDLKRHWNMEETTYLELLNKQNNQCLICKTTEFTGKGKKAHIDHDHKTGKIRGLLCNLCNIGLGAFKDNINFLQNAIEYLTKG